MSFPRYPEYKDSGVEWLGEVPAHWEVEPCRAVFTERSERNDPLVNEDYLSLMANVGVIPYADKGDVGNKKPEDLTKCKLVFAGDLVINSMNYGIGSYGLSSYTGICSPVYIVLTPKLERIEERFAFRILENKAFQGFAQSHGNGILEHRAAINWDILKGIGVPLPPVPEQLAILQLLDRETAKIDALVAEQEKLIVLLQEKRQAVISHAVTKGLDPNVPMKDSGVDWLGEVPGHWEVARLNTIASCNDEVLLESTPEDYEIEYVEISGVQAGQGITETTTLPFGNAPSRARRVIREGDVLISTVRTYLRAIAQVKSPPANMIASTGFAVLRPRRIASGFLGYACHAEGFVSEVIARSVGVSYPAINASELARLPLPLPTEPEQTAIATFLDRETAKIDTLMTEARTAITLLQERRTALISAAVTGQIDVRGLAGGTDAPDSIASSAYPVSAGG